MNNLPNVCVEEDPDNPGTYWTDTAPLQLNTDGDRLAYVTGDDTEVMTPQELRTLAAAALVMADHIESR